MSQIKEFVNKPFDLTPSQPIQRTQQPQSISFFMLCLTLKRSNKINLNENKNTEQYNTNMTKRTEFQ